MPLQQSLLPPSFETLEPWVADWALGTENERRDKRLKSTRGPMTGFYQALQPELRRILKHVDEFPLGDMPEPSTRLFYLALMLAEIAPNVELYHGDPNVPHSYDEPRFVSVQGDVND